MRKRAALFAVLTAALLLLIVPAVALNPLRVAGLFVPGPVATSWTSLPSGLVATYDADLSVANPAVALTVTGQVTIGSCANGNTYRVYYTYVTPLGETLPSPASSDFAFTLSTGHMNLSRSDTPPVLATAWNVYWSKASEGHSILRRSSQNVAIATTTSTSSCTGSVAPPSTNGTGRAAIGGLYTAGWRMAKYTTGTPGTWTPDAYQLDISSAWPQWSSDVGAHFDPLAIDDRQTRRVCPNCRYTTIAAAVASITDAAANKPYTIYFSGKSDSCRPGAYTWIVGEGRGATHCGGAGFDDNTSEAGITNLTVDQTLDFGAGGGSRRSNYVVNVTLGLPVSAGGASVDAIIDFGPPGTAPVDFFLIGSDTNGTFDNLNLGQNFNYIGVGNTFRSESPNTGANSCVRFMRLTNQMTSMQEFNSFMDFKQHGHAVGSEANGQSSESTFIDWNYNNTLSSPQVPSLIRLYNVTSRMVIDDATRTQARTSCFLVRDAQAISQPTTVDIRNWDCQISTTASGETINGITVPNDSGVDNWTFNWTGGRIKLTGGAAQNDVNNARAGFTVNLDNVEHAGNYTGAGGLVVRRSRLFSGVMRDDGLATKPATCRVGDTYIDNTGGAVAFCLCTAANTWTAVGGTGTCN